VAHRLPTWLPAGSPLVEAHTPAMSGHSRGGLCRSGIAARALLVPAGVALARWRCQTWRDAGNSRVARVGRGNRASSDKLAGCGGLPAVLGRVDVTRYISSSCGWPSSPS